MKVWVYTFAWNEEKMLPFFFSHYLDWLGVSRITVFDNESTDGTAELCDETPKVQRVVYRTENTHSELNAMTRIRNECWKEATGEADLVIVVDCDEFLHHNDMRTFLGDILYAPVAVVRATGFDMVSATFPADSSHLPSVIRNGVLNSDYSKPCILVPARIAGISFSPGAHSAEVQSTYSGLTSAGLRLLHYPRLGWEFYRDRMLSRRDRSSPQDKAKGLLWHYAKDIDTMRKDFDVALRTATDCVT